MAGWINVAYSRPSTSGDRPTTSAEPSSKGCATAAGGSTQSMPRSSELKKGDADASGWIAEQTS